MLYFIVNPNSRTGKGLLIWRNVKKYLRDNNVDFKAMKTEYEGHATKLATELCEKIDGQFSLVVIGGDGTINEVINGITDFDKVRFGVIPTGSGNDFARGMGIKGTPEEIIKKIVATEDTRAFDIGKVSWNNCEESRYFAISSGVGLDAIVCKKALTSKLKKVLNFLHLGKLTYIILTVQTLFTMTTASFKVKLDEEERQLEKVIFGAAMNLKAEGGGVPMAPNASAVDGKLSMCLVHTIPKWRTFFCLPILCMAKHEKLKGFDIVDCRKCEIEIDKPMVLHCDGEYIDDVDRVVFECVPEKINIIDTF